MDGTRTGVSVCKAHLSTFLVGCTAFTALSAKHYRHNFPYFLLPSRLHPHTHKQCFRRLSLCVWLCSVCGFGGSLLCPWCKYRVKCIHLCIKMCQLSPGAILILVCACQTSVKYLHTLLVCWSLKESVWIMSVFGHFGFILAISSVK